MKGHVAIRAAGSQRLRAQDHGYLNFEATSDCSRSGDQHPPPLSYQKYLMPSWGLTFTNIFLSKLGAQKLYENPVNIFSIPHGTAPPAATIPTPECSNQN
eukprot:768205-Hanusia_phi.AAC.1